jgi:hypothetical protein
MARFMSERSSKGMRRKRSSDQERSMIALLRIKIAAKKPVGITRITRAGGRQAHAHQQSAISNQQSAKMPLSNPPV